MELLHFSAQPVVYTPQKYRQQARTMKPHGLWVSVGMAWREWCKEQEWNMDGVRYVANVSLVPDAKILHLNGTSQIHVFAKKYIVPGPFHTIDWLRLADSYHGILIDPYCYELRFSLDFLWYYGWDCASGCIWDCRAIKTVEPEPALYERYHRAGRR